jgi:hypothetical protein
MPALASRFHATTFQIELSCRLAGARLAAPK